MIFNVYSPGFTGIFLVWRHYGLKGLGSFFQRLTLWRVPRTGWWFLILGIPVLFFAGVVAISVVLTPLFNASRGSLLIAVLYHFQMMNPIWPDAQPWDSLLIIIAAVIIVWLNRSTMFHQGDGVPEVLLPEDRDVDSRLK